MKSTLFLSGLLAGLAFVSPAAAQWRTVTYDLKPGWSSIYLPGDASWQTLDQHLAALPDIEEIWRWNPNPQPSQFSSTPSEPAAGTPEWSVWRKGQPLFSDLAILSGQSAYLVKLRADAPAQSVTLKQRVEPPRAQWLRSGANLLAFPTKKNGSVFPTFSNYFGSFAPATASKIFRYNGGPLNANNPVRVLSPASERMDAAQAYWFESKTVSDFVGPLHFELSDPAGLNFGKNGGAVTVTVRNRTAAAQTLSFAPAASEIPPAGQAPIAGPVVLTRREFNTTTGRYDDSPFDAPFSAVIPASGSVQFSFGVNRGAMPGAPGAFFASLLRVTDAGNMMDVHLPVTAGAASQAGLWVGDAELTDVASRVPGFAGTKTERSFPLRYLIHVDAGGRATLLSQVYLGVLDGPEQAAGISTSETLLSAAQKDKAMRLTAAHLPLDRVISTSGSFGPGATITGTINLPHNNPVNPFVHQYHPDHDNKDARNQTLPAGKESYTVNRAVTFSIPSAAPAGQEATWGSRVITGDYSETFTGLHKQPITATGTFILRRVSENPVLSTP